MQTPRPNPQSQSFSRSYGSILPTSLIYIILSTRGCSPWRPDAVMSTTWQDRKLLPHIFKDRHWRAGHHETCGALPASEPYLRMIRFQGLRAVKKKRELFPGPMPTSAGSLDRYRQPPCPGKGILTLFPFDGRRERIAPLIKDYPIS